MERVSFGTTSQMWSVSTMIWKFEKKWWNSQPEPTLFQGNTKHIRCSPETCLFIDIKLHVNLKSMNNI